MHHLMKWSPFFEAFDHFDEVFKDTPSLALTQKSLIPPLDMYETKDAVVVEMPLAGADPKKVSVEVEDGVLTVKGSCERKTEVEEKNYYRKEIRSGQIFRQVQLPARTEEDRAEAVFQDGLLKVTVPKSKEIKTKSIKIDVKKKDA